MLWIKWTLAETDAKMENFIGIPKALTQFVAKVKHLRHAKYDGETCLRMDKFKNAMSNGHVLCNREIIGKWLNIKNPNIVAASWGQ